MQPSNFEHFAIDYVCKGYINIIKSINKWIFLKAPAYYSAW